MTIHLLDKFRGLAAGRHDGFEVVDKGGPKLGLSRGGRTWWVPRRLVQFPNGEVNHEAPPAVVGGQVTKSTKGDKG